MPVPLPNVSFLPQRTCKVTSTFLQRRGLC